MKAMDFIKGSCAWNDYSVEEFYSTDYNYNIVVGALVDGATYALMTDARLGRADALVERKNDNKQFFAYLIEE